MNLVFLLLLLIVLNGIFAMAEIAVVSSRKARLQKLADEGSLGAKVALRLHDDPSSFLSTVQVGITSIGILSGVVGEDALAVPIADWLAGFSTLEHYARPLSVGFVVVLITYLSVVIGELVPKRLALLAPESIAAVIAGPMSGLARATRPLVWLFSVSGDVILRPFNARRSDEPPVTDEEIKVLMEQGAEAGVFHESEQEIVSNVLRLDEQRIGTIMTPRKDVHFVDLEEPQELRNTIADTEYGRLVVCRGGLENVLGVLHVADLLKPALSGEVLDVESAIRPALYVPETVTTSQLLENFRKTRVQFALVVDEYGELEGVVSLTDVLTSIVGELPADDEEPDSDAIRREDGSWLIEASMSVERFHDFFEVDELPGSESGGFHTIGGFVMHMLGRVPRVADHFECMGMRFEVVDMDRHRVDKLLLTIQEPDLRALLAASKD
ncbi:hemolysin family protein [Uliginosibacterium aquaticum]|uniref:HlyC/CorC family transporter n=1 Tax=Uliginosibacterium aquaticum TaxID=2731212 RepID=A0ABX2ICM2_9RHOO|nr:hemolysin family protein [Uliginosibacterium aquaticum]NSL54254.1 HlyC/CorC family transporter [Uliginosibacterium aquaticum]